MILKYVLVLFLALGCGSTTTESTMHAPPERPVAVESDPEDNNSVPEPAPEEQEPAPEGIEVPDGPTGLLTREQIQTVIRRHTSQMRYCYERELQQDPDLAGRVVVTFLVTTDGSVGSAIVRSSELGSSATEQCMLERIRNWTFPEPERGGHVLVTYPFVFGTRP